jgi:hypothetical protein
MSKIKLLLFFSLVLLSSCVGKNPYHIDPIKNPELADQSWISENTCEVPCWHNLNVNSSTKEETINMISQLTFLSNDSTQNGDWFFYQCKNPPNITCVSVLFRDDILFEVQQYINYQITFERVVDKIGPPEKFFYIQINPEKKDCNIFALWIIKQMEIEIDYKGNRDVCNSIIEENGKFPKDLPISNVNYLSKNVIDEMIKLENSTEVDGYIFSEWKGFQ